MRLFTAAESRLLDAKTREGLGLSERQLIERAGREAALFAAERYGPLRGRRVDLLCGKGHNAADGLVAARHLASSGADVGLHLAFGEGGLGDEAAVACKGALAAGAVLRELGDLAQADLIFDALLGTGSRGPLRGALARLVEAANAAPAPILALDLPTGLDADGGPVAEPCIRAEATLSFLGVGVPSPQPAWGVMLNDGRAGLMTGSWWLSVFPGLCIVFVVLAASSLGDWFRVWSDPQLRQL